MWGRFPVRLGRPWGSFERRPNPQRSVTHRHPQANPRTLLWQHCPRFLAGVLTALIATTAGCGGPTTDGDTILLSSNEFGNWQVVVLDVDSSMTYQITGDPSDAGPPSTYQVLDLSDGPVVEMVDPSWSDVDPTWSPDGEHIAVSSNRFGDFELLVLDGRGSVLDQLTDNATSDGQPSWSPNGEWIAFTSDRTGDVEIFVMRPDGTQVEQLTYSPGEDWQPAWSPDSQFLAFASNRNGNWDIFVMRPDGTQVEQLTYSPDSDLEPVWSPDGRHLTFTTNRRGNLEVYLMDLADGKVRATGQRGIPHGWRTG